MFKAVQPGLTLDLDPKRIVNLQRSSNTIVMPLSGPPRPTRAQIVSFYDPRGTYRVFVFLGQPERDTYGVTQGMLFRSEPEEVTLTNYDGLQREAAQMVRGQGFQMEKVEIQTLDEFNRAALLSELPFSPDRLPPPPVAQAAAQPMMQARISMPDLAAKLPTGSHRAAPVVEVSREISLPSRQAIEQLGKLLALF